MKKITTILAALFLLVFTSSAQEKIELHYSFEEGDEFSINHTLNQETYISADGIRRRTTNDKDADLLLKVEEINPEGSARFTAEYKRIVLSTSQSHLELSVNTDGGEEDTFNKMFKALIGKPFSLTLSPTGEVLSVENMEPIFDDMIDAVKLKKKQRPVLKEFLTNQLGGDQMKVDLSFILPAYPDRKVAEKDTWSSHLTTESLYNGNIDNNWELTFGNKDVAKLQNQGHFSATPSDKMDVGTDTEGFVNLKGDIESQFMIDVKSGWPTRGITNVEMNGEFTFEQKKGGETERLKVPIRIVQNGSYEIKHL